MELEFDEIAMEKKSDGEEESIVETERNENTRRKNCDDVENLEELENLEWKLEEKEVDNAVRKRIEVQPMSSSRPKSSKTDCWLRKVQVTNMKKSSGRVSARPRKSKSNTNTHILGMDIRGFFQSKDEPGLTNNLLSPGEKQLKFTHNPLGTREFEDGMTGGSEI